MVEGYDFIFYVVDELGEEFYLFGIIMFMLFVVEEYDCNDDDDDEYVEDFDEFEDFDDEILCYYVIDDEEDELDKFFVRMLVM